MILLDCPASVVETVALVEWASDYNKITGEQLLDGLTMISSLSPTGYTMWKDLIDER